MDTTTTIDIQHVSLDDITLKNFNLLTKEGPTSVTISNLDIKNVNNEQSDCKFSYFL